MDLLREGALGVSHGKDEPGRQDDAVARVCLEFGYPEEVEHVLRGVLDHLKPLAPESVLLHGSTARGELTWWRDGTGRVRLASDIEMYVVCPAQVSAAERHAANRSVEVLTKGVNAGGPVLFHIDLGYTTVEGIRRHPRTFRCWDTYATGRTLLGRDIRDQLPEVDALTLDFKQLNEVPIHRLWEMVFRVPASMLRGEASSDEEVIFSYVCARQALDLTTWLLPHSGILIPTFRKRVDEWNRQFHQLPLSGYFSASSGAFLRECLEGKLHFRFVRPPVDLHRDVLECFRAALRLLLDAGPEADDQQITCEIRAQGADHWHVEPPRRRVYEAFLLLRDGAVLRPSKAVRWWLRKKKPLQVAFLLHLNAALADLLARRLADQSMELAESLLADLWYEFRPHTGALVERFLHARRGYVEYLTRTSRWFAPRSDYLVSVIEDR